MRAGEPALGLLRDRSYSEARWESDTNRFGPAVHLVLRSEASSREVDLGLFVGEVRPVATVSIYRLPGEKLADKLSLRLFAEKHVPKLDLKRLDMDATQPLRDEAARVFRMYAELLEGPALPIVEGTSWEEGHYYDWTLHG